MRAAPFLASLAAIALAVPVLSGCGAEEAAGVDVAQAASTTAGKGTARVKIVMAMEGLGLPDGMTMEADGVMALKEPKGDLTFDLGGLLSANGQGAMKIRFDGGDLYVDPPDVPGLDIPGGWLAISLPDVARAMGIDPEAAGSLFTMDAASQLRVMRAAGNLEEAGTEEINGVETVHLKGAYSIDDLIASLPPDRAAGVEQTVQRLNKLEPGSLDRDEDYPVELWVDDKDIVHRMRTSAELPGQGGEPAGRMSMIVEMSDFGVPLDVSRPKDTTDVTDDIVGVLEQQGAVLGKSGGHGG